MNGFPYASRKYEILPYDPNWSVRFNALAESLSKIFGSDSQAIEHVGSTSVPGMYAKPVIDVLVVVPSVHELESHRQDMERTGYVYQGEIVQEDSRLYREVENGDIRANIHVFPVEHPHVFEMLRLRDYLRTHPDDVQEYSEVKKSLQEKYPNDYAEHRRQKDRYLNDTLKKRALR